MNDIALEIGIWKLIFDKLTSVEKEMGCIEATIGRDRRQDGRIFFLRSYRNLLFFCVSQTHPKSLHHESKDYRFVFACGGCRQSQFLVVVVVVFVSKFLFSVLSASSSFRRRRRHQSAWRGKRLIGAKSWVDSTSPVAVRVAKIPTPWCGGPPRQSPR